MEGLRKCYWKQWQFIIAVLAHQLDFISSDKSMDHETIIFMVEIYNIGNIWWKLAYLKIWNYLYNTRLKKYVDLLRQI